jgi:phenylpropionate dioxygenase-like ring-hydroxylating dioxygenase large terminal subunit
MTLSRSFCSQYWIHLSGDHGVSSRLTPTGPHTTEARVDWLVHEDAVEGRDYDLEKMLPFWSKTSDQDWHLVRRNSKLVSFV